MIVLWNTIYIEAALNQLRKEGYEMNDDDVCRLSPLLHEHINMLGRYSFSMPDAVANGELRPLRNPRGYQLMKILNPVFRSTAPQTPSWRDSMRASESACCGTRAAEIIVDVHKNYASRGECANPT
jgi:hypothetical protein